MYEKLDKLREEVKRCKKKLEDDRAKLKVAESKLQEAERTQILADVNAVNLSPEQLAEFLKLVTSGKAGIIPSTDTYREESDEDPEDDNDNESEDNEDD